MDSLVYKATDCDNSNLAAKLILTKLPENILAAFEKAQLIRNDNLIYP